MEQIFIIEDGTLTKFESDETAQGYRFHSAGLTPPCEL